VALAAFLVAWLFVFRPYADAGGVWLSALIGHPIGSLFVFAIAVLGLLVTGPPRSRAILDTFAAGCLLAMTTLLAVLVSASQFQPIRVLAGLWLWISFHVLLGAAALRPVPRAAPHAGSRPTLSVGRALLFAALALFGPLAWTGVIVWSGPENVAEAAVPVVLGAVVSLLLLWRVALTARVAQRGQRRLARRTRSLVAANEEQRRLQQQLQYQATHDALTGLVNRTVLRDVLDRTVHDGAYPLVVLMLDLDGFKQANDSRGHVVGDEVLCLVAQRCRPSCRMRPLLLDSAETSSRRQSRAQTRARGPGWLIACARS
jgi:hypothetical protein